MIEFLFSDVDGVWNDDCYYYLENGSQMRKFSTKDSAGLLLLNACNIQTLILSGDNNNASRERFQSLGVTGFYGIRNKGEFIRNWARDNNISLTNIGYVGNDINDVSVFRLLHMTFAPMNTPDYVKKYVTNVFSEHPQPGDGYFRFVVEKYLESQDMLENAYDHIIEGF
jgi:3-deoxy-D-glycero-D-galacto-nononate 9-phosphatase